MASCMLVMMWTGTAVVRQRSSALPHFKGLSAAGAHHLSIQRAYSTFVYEAMRSMRAMKCRLPSSRGMKRGS